MHCIIREDQWRSLSPRRTATVRDLSLSPRRTATLTPSESVTPCIALLGALALLSFSCAALHRGQERDGGMAQLVFNSENNLVLLSLDNKNASFALVLLSSPPTFFTGSSTPTVAILPRGTCRSLLYAVGFQSTLLAVKDALAIRIHDHANGQGSLRLY